MYIGVCIFVKVYEFSIFHGLFLSVNHFWWCMSISEYIFVLFLSFCRTTKQKLRPLGILSLCYRFLNPDLLSFGLHFCLAWFGMFGFFTSLSVYVFLYEFSQANKTKDWTFVDVACACFSTFFFVVVIYFVNPHLFVQSSLIWLSIGGE